MPSPPSIDSESWRKMYSDLISTRSQLDATIRTWVMQTAQTGSLATQLIAEQNKNAQLLHHVQIMQSELEQQGKEQWKVKYLMGVIAGLTEQ